MTRLIIDGQELDFFQDERITLEKSTPQLTGLTNSLTEFTRTFTIPASQNNNNILKYYGELNVVDSYNPHKAIEAILVIDDTKTLKGSLELGNVNYESGSPTSYSITFYGALVSLKANLTDIKLNDTDAFDSLDSIISLANIKSSWEGTYKSGNVLFPMVGNNRNMIYAIDNDVPLLDGNQANIAAPVIGNDTTSTYTGILFKDLKPAYNFKTLVDLMFTKLGMTTSYSSTLEAFIDTLHVMPSPKAGSLFEGTDKNKVTAEISINYEPDPAGAIKYIDLLEIEDPDSNWDDVTHSFTAPIDHIYRMNLTSYNYIPSGGDPFTQINGYSINGVAQTSSEREFEVFSELGRHNSTEFYISLSQGDVVKFYFAFDGNNLDYDHDIDYVKLSVRGTDTAFSGEEIKAKDVMPNMTAYDFISQWLKSWNLLIIQENDTKVLITDYDTYYANGTTRDWTQYIDTTKATSNKPDVSKHYIFKHKENKDRISEFFKLHGNREYGQFDVYNDIDYGKDKEEVTSPFSVIAPSFMDDVDVVNEKQVKSAPTDLPIQVQMGEGTSKVNADFLMFYYNGISPVAYRYYLQSGNTTAGLPIYTKQDTFPIISSSQDYPSTDGYTVAYGMENTLLGSVPMDSIYKVFFDDLVQRTTSKETKVLTVEGLLSSNEYLSFEMNDIITIENLAYIVQKITYDLLDGTTKLSLLSYNPDYIRTDLTPLNGSKSTTVYVHKANSVTQLDSELIPESFYKTYGLQKDGAAKATEIDCKWVTDIVVEPTREVYEPSGGSGDVGGPSSSTDNAIARWDGTTGKAIQDSDVYITDDGKLGIGNDIPSASLDVLGDATVDELNINDEYTFPTLDGGNNQVLTTDGIGNVTWEDAQSGGQVNSVVGGTNITVDATDPANPIVNSQAGLVDTVVAGNGIEITGDQNDVVVSAKAGTAITVGAGGIAVAQDGVGAIQLNVSGNGTLGQVLSSDADGSFTWVDQAEGSELGGFYFKRKYAASYANPSAGYFSTNASTPVSTLMKFHRTGLLTDEVTDTFLSNMGYMIIKKSDSDLNSFHTISNVDTTTSPDYVIFTIASAFDAASIVTFSAGEDYSIAFGTSTANGGTMSSFDINSDGAISHTIEDGYEIKFDGQDGLVFSIQSVSGREKNVRLDISTGGIQQVSIAANAIDEDRLEGLGTGTSGQYVTSNGTGGFTYSSGGGEVNVLIEEYPPTTGDASMTYSGSVVSHVAGESLTMASVCYIKSYLNNPRTYKARALSSLTTPALVIYCESPSISAGTKKKYISRGIVKNATIFNFASASIGDPVYLSTTTYGAVTTTIPSGSGEFVQVLGYVLDADTMMFDPNLVMVEIA